MPVHGVTRSSSSSPPAVRFEPLDGRTLRWSEEVDGMRVAPRAQVEQIVADEVTRRFGAGPGVRVQLSEPHGLSLWSDDTRWVRAFAEVSVNGENAATIVVDATGRRARLRDVELAPARTPEVRDADPGRVPVAPHTWYEPVSDFDRALVTSNPAARQLLAGSAAAKLTVAGGQRLMVGDVAGASIAYAGAWQAFFGVIAPKL